MTNYIDISIIDVIKKCIDNFRLGGTISAITDNADGTYTITVSNLGLLTNGWALSITGTTNFTGEYVCEAINLTAKTFKIRATAGKTITTLGAFTCINPIFYFEKWSGAKNEIYQQVVDYVSAAKQFPCCLLLLDITENYTDSYIEIPELTVYFFEQTDGVRNSAWRHINTMPKLRAYYQKFITELSQSESIIGKFDHEKTERFYLGTADKNQNKIGIIDAIEIVPKNIKLINSNC